MARKRLPSAALSARSAASVSAAVSRRHEDGRGDQGDDREHAERGQQPAEHGVGQAGR